MSASAVNHASEHTIQADVLSGPGQALDAGEDLRDLLVLLDNGQLHVAKSELLNQRVMSYQQDLQRKRIAHVVVPSDIDAIRALYAGGDPQQVLAARTNGSVSHRQEQVLKIIRSAVQSGASDLHFLRRGETTTSVIRQRVHGVLDDLLKMPGDDVAEMMSCIYQSMCDGASDPSFMPGRSQDARIKLSFLASAGLFGARVATRPTDDGLAMVLRLLYNAGTRVRSLAELGYSEKQAEQIRIMSRRKEGINIFSGATGSGKSTTLEVLMGMLIRHFDHHLNVMTLEDPPEYRIAGAVQTPVLSGDWAGSIRNMMRMDPDVLMIGEMRDADSSQAAFRAAITGHGVWTTLHANDAVAILQRLADLGIDSGLMLDPSTVTGLINQSLARRLCDHCKTPWLIERPILDPDLIARVEKHCHPESVFLAGPGCDQCGGRGVVGRTVIAEVIVPTLAFMLKYQKEGKAAARDYWVREMGGDTKTSHMIAKINAGLLDPKQAEENVGPIDADHYAVAT